ncbi:MAG: Rieske (2Fe-2S) protein [Planctomycetales bacterium]|nr:Rieske (2Fe-2S) protein [Planctomycetales bacterium]
MTDVRRECEDVLRESPRPPSGDASDVERRDFLSVAAAVGMGGGLVAGYGTFGVIAARFLDAPGQPMGWQYLTTVDELKPGDSLTYAAPNGAKVVIARQGAGTSAEDFVALSSVCPHLGCAVHWEPQNDRFFCPCHNGVFDRQGMATEGPPAKAKQRLLEFPLKVENGLLYIQVPLVALANAECVDDTGTLVKQAANGATLPPQQGDMA